MRYVIIPKTDLKVSVICMGGMAFSDLDNIEMCIKIFDKYFELGGNFIDTANLYGKWLPEKTNISEIELGNWIKKRKIRNKLVIGTKGGHPDLSSLDVSRISKKEVYTDLNESLRSLKIDFIDIYFLHRDDESKPVEEIIDFLNDFIKEGKIRYYGFSNWKVYRIKEALKYADGKGIKGFAGCQMMWSLAEPNVENIKDKSLVIMNNDIMNYYKSINIAAIPYSSQARGFFELLHKSENDPQFSAELKKIKGGWLNQDLYKIYENEKNLRRYHKVKKLASDLSLSISEIILGYLISQPFVTIPIIGSDNVEQLTTSLKAGDILLNEEVINYLQDDDRM